MKYFIVSMILLFGSGCSWINVITTPVPVIDLVARANAVAKSANKDNPKTQEDIAKYLKINAEAWETLARYYGLENERTK